MRTLKTLALTSTFSATFAFSLAAFAAAEGETCSSAADCDAGLTCEVTGAMGCAVPDCPPDTACEVPACEPAVFSTCVKPPCQVDADCGAGLRCAVETMEACSDCAVPEGTEPPADCGGCTTETYTMCVPLDCTADADCGDPNLVCIQQTWEACPDVAVAPCTPDGECPVPEQPACTTETVSYCGPKYLDDCSADADCGEGFTCVPEQSCWCSGGAAVDPSTDPSVEPVPVEETCGCEPTGRNYCEPQQIECPVGDECPAGWECAAGPTVALPCAEGEACPDPAPSPAVCLPPSWGGIGYYGTAANEGGVAYGTVGGDKSLVDLLDAPSAEDTAGAADDSASSDEGGCSVAQSTTPTPTAFGLLALLGLALVKRRRAAR